jgi:hypothetical protein
MQVCEVCIGHAEGHGYHTDGIANSRGQPDMQGTCSCDFVGVFRVIDVTRDLCFSRAMEAPNRNLKLKIISETMLDVYINHKLGGRCN